MKKENQAGGSTPLPNTPKYIPIHEDLEYIKVKREMAIKYEREAATLRKRAQSLLATADKKSALAKDYRKFLQEVNERKKQA